MTFFSFTNTHSPLERTFSFCCAPKNKILCVHVLIYSLSCILLALQNNPFPVNPCIGACPRGHRYNNLTSPPTWALQVPLEAYIHSMSKVFLAAGNGRMRSLAPVCSAQLGVGGQHTSPIHMDTTAMQLPWQPASEVVSPLRNALGAPDGGSSERLQWAWISTNLPLCALDRKTAEGVRTARAEQGIWCVGLLWALLSFPQGWRVTRKAGLWCVLGQIRIVHLFIATLPWDIALEARASSQCWD